MRRIHYSITLFLLWSASEITSQSQPESHLDLRVASQSQPGSHLDLRVGGGMLLPIYEPFPASSVVTSLECSMFKKKINHPSWRGVYSRARFGWTAQIMDLGNPRVLGQSLSMSPIAEIVHRINDRTSLHGRIGIGIGYFTRHYDLESNPANNVIGSRWANVSRFHLEWRKQVAQQWRLGVGVHFVHCSNAHTSVPNVGANVIGLHVTMAKNKIPPKNKDDMAFILLLIGYNKRLNIHVGGGYGLHAFEGSTQPADGPLYKDPVAYAQMGIVHRHRSSLYAGLQWTQYNSYRHYLLVNELVKAKDLTKSIQNYTLYLGYDWYFPHASFFVQGGAQVYNPATEKVKALHANKDRGWLYQRTAAKIGYRLYLFDPMRKNTVSPYLQVAVKTNGGTADFLEATLGLKVDW
jgi:hypothetical protein